MRAWVTLGLCVTSCAAQAIVASKWNSSSSTVQDADHVELAISNGGRMDTLASLQPLTTNASSSLPTPGISGTVLFANTSTQLASYTLEDVIFISCDSTNYPGNIMATDLFAAAEQARAKAIVFYTLQQDWCNLQSYTGSYWAIYSFKNASDATEVMTDIYSQGGTTVYATVASPATIDAAVNSTGTGTPQSGNSTNSNPNTENALGASASTAVAMIILYSITGVITALFLVIIVTGAVRAHRHPERYGPRNMLGRARQSRAKGLARAMLDGLPIVKFGQAEGESNSKDGDAELVEHGEAPRSIVQAEGAVNAEKNIDMAHSLPEAALNNTTSGEGGIAAGAASAAPPQQTSVVPQTSDDTQGCSICTDDFEVGQDQRVLPCNHKFHPACVDPWLLNVSGTCPLCRIDLRPQHTPEGGELDEEGNPVVVDGETLPPPLNDTAAPRNGRRRSVFNAFRNSMIPPPFPRANVSADQRSRIEQASVAAQRARAEAQATGVTPNVEEESRRRRRFRTMFGIRTGRTGRDGQVQTELAERSLATDEAPAIAGSELTSR